MASNKIHDDVTSVYRQYRQQPMLDLRMTPARLLETDKTGVSSAVEPSSSKGAQYVRSTVAIGSGRIRDPWLRSRMGMTGSRVGPIVQIKRWQVRQFYTPRMSSLVAASPQPCEQHRMAPFPPPSQQGLLTCMRSSNLLRSRSSLLSSSAWRCLTCTLHPCNNSNTYET